MRILILTLFLGFGFWAPSSGAGKPNIVLVITDDQGYGDLSCHGNPILRTPYLDTLHDESVRFINFHVAPMCTPTRGELMTGQYALRNGATFVCMGRSLPDSPLPTLAAVFTANGYRTGHFGKWHLGDNYPFRPQDRGFRDTIHHPAWGITSAADYFGNDYFDDTFRHNGVNEPFEGYCTDVWFREATSWIDAQGDRLFSPASPRMRLTRPSGCRMRIASLISIGSTTTSPASLA